MSGLRRSTRDRGTKAVTPNRQTLRAGYDYFTAGDTETTASGVTVTTASLSIGGQDYDGSSGGIGHAEMLALNNCIEANGLSLEDLRHIPDKTVSCPAKPVCYRCAIVLGLLGFTAESEDTLKTKSGMGQKTWTLPSPLKDLIALEYGDIGPLLDQFSNVDKI